MDITQITQYLAAAMLVISFGLTIWSLYYNKKQADIRELSKDMLFELREIRKILMHK